LRDGDRTKVADGERTGLSLVQVDPHYTFHHAERGRPKLHRIEADAWNAGAFTPLHPISASVATCDTDFPQIRFLMDPDPPVTQATQRIR
jgi:hypothetical protein